MKGQPNHINKLNITKSKQIKYCSFVSNMLSKNNKYKIKQPAVLTIIDYLNIYEQLEVRVVSKMFNDCVKNKLDFLNSENLMSRSKIKLHSSNYKKELYKSYSMNMNDSTTNISFNQSEEKFSRKKVLLNLISNKNFNTIKQRVELGRLTKSKNLQLN